MVTMADSDALRQRRRKAHKQGDHSLCRRCPAVRLAPLRPAPDIPHAPADAPDQVTDAPLELRRLAARMVTAHEADPANAILGAELRKTLTELIPKDQKKNPDADVADLFGALQT